MDETLAEQIVARALACLGKRHRAERLVEYPRELVAEAMLGAILLVDHPSTLTPLMCDIVREYGPDTRTVERAMTVMRDDDVPMSTRAACLRAIGRSERVEAQWLAAGLAGETLDRLDAMQAGWDNSIEGHELWLSQFEDPEPQAPALHATDLEVHRAMRNHASDYESFIEDAFRFQDPDAGIHRFTSAEPEFVAEALVDYMLRCSPVEREGLRAVATTLGVRSPIANARLVDAVLDSGTAWDLRVEAFILYAALNGGRPDAVPVAPWTEVDAETWARLQQAYVLACGPVLAWNSDKFVPLIATLRENDFQELMDEIYRRELSAIHWAPLLYDERVAHLWPAMAEHLAAAGMTEHIGSLVALVDDIEDRAGAARVQRAIMRLRALVI